MTGIKISALNPIPSSQLTDIAPFVQSGTTYQASISQISTLLSSTLTLNSVIQVTGLPTLLAGFLPLTGGTMSGDLFLNGNPAFPNQAANKAYVDLSAGGFTVILSCFAGTTGNLPATQAGAGIGATLTDNSGTFAAFTVDSTTPALNSRILVKNQLATQHNGVYVLTTNGDTISIPWQLTRATDYDTAAQIKPGTLVAVNNGTANATTSWLETATVVTVDTDPVLFSQFTFAPSAFLQIANNLAELTPTAATARTNIGLGSVATKTASDASKTFASMINGAITIGHIAVFSDVNGTIQDGGAAPSPTVANPFNQINTQTITATGAFAYVPTTGAKYAIFELQAGGGGTGGTTGASNQGGTSAGASAGNNLKILVVGSTNLGMITGSVGIAGANGASGNHAGTNGGITTLTINGGTTWVAQGGIASAGAASSASANGKAGAASPSANTIGTNGTLIENLIGAQGCDSCVSDNGSQPKVSGNGGVSANGYYGNGGKGLSNTGGSNQPGFPGIQGVVIVTEFISV